MQFTIDQALQQGITAHKEGKLQEADKLYTAILRSQPQHPDANHNMGVLAVSVNKIQEALPFFKNALKANPTVEQYWVSYLNALLKLEKFDKAKALFDQAKKANMTGEKLNALEQAILSQQNNNHPTQEQISNLLSLFENGAFEETLKKGNALASQFPNNPNLLNILGAVNLKQRNLKEAQKNFEDALKVNYLDAGAYQNFALVLDGLEKIEEANKNRMRAILSQPNLVSPLKHLINYFLDTKQVERAELLLRQRPLFKRNTAFFLWQIGMVCYHRSEHSLAENYFDKAISLNPDSERLYFNRGQSAFILNKHNEAYQYYRKASILNPTFIEPYFHVASAAYHIDLSNLGEKVIAYALILKPDYAEALNLRALFMLDAFDLKAAEAYSRKSLLADPSYEAALDNYKISVFLDKGYIPKDFSPHNIKSSLSGDIQETSITSLVSMGRSGSLFLHSLFDGHPQISTLPGVYFKGWFSSPTWEIFKPDYTQPNWRETLANRIIQKYEPMFDARSKRNVPGKPLKGNWISRNLGFMNMGPDRKEHFYADKERFYTQMLALLKPFTEVTQKIVFELIHQAFKNCFEGDIKKEPDKPSSIFYHIHNPSFEELSHYRDTYPNSKQLLIVRNPVQSLESHITSVLPEDSWEGNSADFSTIIKNWTQVNSTLTFFLFTFTSPNVDSKSWRGVKLEDLKSNPKETLEKLVQWIGIPFHPTLLNSTFGNLEYWGPLSPNSAPIRGFDKANLQQKKGRFFGRKDIEILETLLLPFSVAYGYSDTSIDELSYKLKHIQPLLDKPLEYEQRLFINYLPKSTHLDELVPYRNTHNLLKFLWHRLNNKGSYPSMVPPL